MRGGVPINRALQPLSSSVASVSFVFFLPPRSPIHRKAMSGEAERALSGTSTAMSACPGAAEAPREAGAQAAEEAEVVSRPALAGSLERLVTLAGPERQEEAGARALRKAHILAALQTVTAGIPGTFTLWNELARIEQVSALFPGSLPEEKAQTQSVFLLQADDEAISKMVSELLAFMHRLASGREPGPGNA